MVKKHTADILCDAVDSPKNTDYALIINILLEILGY